MPFNSQAWFLQMMFPVWSKRTQSVKISHPLNTNTNTVFQKYEMTYWTSQWRSQRLSEQLNSSYSSDVPGWYASSKTGRRLAAPYVFVPSLSKSEHFTFAALQRWLCNQVSWSRSIPSPPLLPPPNHPRKTLISTHIFWSIRHRRLAGEIFRLLRCLSCIPGSYDLFIGLRQLIARFTIPLTSHSRQIFSHSFLAWSTDY